MNKNNFWTKLTSIINNVYVITDKKLYLKLTCSLFVNHKWNIKMM